VSWSENQWARPWRAAARTTALLQFFAGAALPALVFFVTLRCAKVVTKPRLKLFYEE